MTYDEALAWWYGRINYERRPAEPGDLKLDRMRALLHLLGDPHRRLRLLHVAGTKGKGSVSAMLAAILRRAGYRTGLFTSPHLVAVEERIQIDDEPIGQTELAALMGDIRTAAEALPAGEGAPTFFEVVTALGLLHFVRRRADLAVLEVGLGGRFDSTNVCTPLLSIITSISYDHTQQLGDKLASIAREKAGIIKPGRPTVSGAGAAEAAEVIERTCRERGSPLIELGRDFSYVAEPGRVVNAPDGAGGWPARVRVRTRRREWPVMELSLLGEHQAANAAVAVAVVEQLRQQGLPLPDAAVAAGLATVRWPARLEVLGTRPLILLDCAHNVASAQALVESLHASFPPGGRRLLVFAASSDKDVRGILRVLAPHFQRAFLTPYRSNPRSVPAKQLAEWVRLAVGDALPCELQVSPEDAWASARRAARPDDLICVSGSVFLAGELRPILLRESGNPMA